MDNNSENNIFLNGKAQMIEMLQYMSVTERNKLLANVRSKNPAIAKELAQESFTFESVLALSNDHFATLLKNIDAIIIGLAIYDLNRDIQKRFLTSVTRPKAEKAFGMMSQDLDKQSNECAKAKKRIIETALKLARKKLISL